MAAGSVPVSGGLVQTDLRQSKIVLADDEQCLNDFT